MVIKRNKRLIPDSYDFENELDEELIINKKEEEYDELEEDEFLNDESYSDIETGFDQNARIQKIWLDADPYINNLYLSITNKEVKKKRVKNSDGEEVIKQYLQQIPGTEPLANSLGVSQIMGFVKGIFSKDIVMGNVDRQQYNDFMYFFTIDLMKMLIVNRKIWNIEVNNVEIIHNMISNGAHFYLTRPIMDGERRSSRGRQDLPQDENKSGFVDRIVSRYKSNNGRV